MKHLQKVNGLAMGIMLVLSPAAFADSLFIAPSGNVGIGTSDPLAPLHVEADNATVFVHDTSPYYGEDKVLFGLAGYGITKFSITNTYHDVEWAFANPGSGFRLSRQGSGVVEFEVYNNGNVNIAGSLTQNSDVNAKTAITEVNSQEILQKVVELPVTQWEYKDARGEPHIGPMAQDFYRSFGLGESETGISTIDTAGVALVAIQALAEQNAELIKQNAELESRVSELEAQAERIRAVEESLEKLKSQSQIAFASDQ